MGIFRFKQFEVENTQSAMKIGTDAVILGAWMNCMPEDATLLDIGCGTGIISLMAAQRTPAAEIHAIDIDSVSCDEAKTNFSRSPWNGRLHVRNISFQEYVSQKSAGSIVFDHIFSNPPYFTNALKCPEERKRQARHNDTLSFAELIKGCHTLLSPSGRVSLIIPESEYAGLIKECEGMFRIFRECSVLTSTKRPPKRKLVELRKINGTEAGETTVTAESITIQEKGKYTQEYISLTKDFHPFF